LREEHFIHRGADRSSDYGDRKKLAKNLSRLLSYLAALSATMTDLGA
jgi:hypothetical protein